MASSLNYLINCDLKNGYEYGFDYMKFRVEYSGSYPDYATLVFERVEESTTPYHLGTYIGVWIYNSQVIELAACFYSPSITPPKIFVKPVKFVPDRKKVEKHLEETGRLPVVKNPIFNHYLQRK